MEEIKLRNIYIYSYVENIRSIFFRILEENLFLRAKSKISSWIFFENQRKLNNTKRIYDDIIDQLYTFKNIYFKYINWICETV